MQQEDCTLSVMCSHISYQNLEVDHGPATCCYALCTAYIIVIYCPVTECPPCSKLPAAWQNPGEDSPIKANAAPEECICFDPLGRSTREIIISSFPGHCFNFSICYDDLYSLLDCSPFCPWLPSLIESAFVDADTWPSGCHHKRTTLGGKPSVMQILQSSLYLSWAFPSVVFSLGVRGITSWWLAQLLCSCLASVNCLLMSFSKFNSLFQSLALALETFLLIQNSLLHKTLLQLAQFWHHSWTYKRIQTPLNSLRSLCFL